MEALRLAVLTTGRQDFGILRSTLVELEKAPDFEVFVLAGGMHLSPSFGNTVDHVRTVTGVHAELAFIDEERDVLRETAGALMRVGEALDDIRPDGLLLVGDRSETLAAGVAATLTGTKIVHMHGGEETEGAIDNAIRHSLTKLSHLHLVSHADHARRVIQMGEDPETVVVVGAPGLDNAYRDDLPDRAQLERDLDINLEDPVVLVTVHPTTLGNGDPLAEVRAVSEAMVQVPATYVVTLPNADSGGDSIRSYWREWVGGRPRVKLVDALGELLHWGLLGVAGAVLGNSSSGIIEAPHAGVPAINVGERQAGRLRGAGVLTVSSDAGSIVDALQKSLAAEPKPGRDGTYPSGPAAPRVVQALRSKLSDVTLRKPFWDNP